MAYNLHNFKDGDILYAQHLNEIEQSLKTLENSLDFVTDTFVTPEMFLQGNEPYVTGTTEINWNKPFTEALKTGLPVKCIKDKHYYFEDIIDLRDPGNPDQMLSIFLDGNECTLHNFHLLANLKTVNVTNKGTTITEIRRAHASETYSIFKNINFGSWSDHNNPNNTFTTQKWWTIPCLILGGPTWLQNVTSSSYPHVLAIPVGYQDILHIDSLVGRGDWTSFVNNCLDGNADELKLDVISCVTGIENEKLVFKNLNETLSQDPSVGTTMAGDGWRFLNCSGFTGMYTKQNVHQKCSNYKFMRITSHRPIIFYQPVEINLDIHNFGNVLFVGGHWESCTVALKGNWGSIITFLNCFFYTNQPIIDHPKVTYERCHWMIRGEFDIKNLVKFTDKSTNTTGYKHWHELNTRLSQCSFGDDTWIIDTDTIKQQRLQGKNTYQWFNKSALQPEQEYGRPAYNKEAGTQYYNLVGPGPLKNLQISAGGSGNYWNPKTQTQKDIYYHIFLISTSQPKLEYDICHTNDAYYETSAVYGPCNQLYNTTQYYNFSLPCAGGYTVLLIKEYKDVVDNSVHYEKVIYYAPKDCVANKIDIADYGQFVVFQNHTVHSETDALHSFKTPALWLPSTFPQVEQYHFNLRALGTYKGVANVEHNNSQFKHEPLIFETDSGALVYQIGENRQDDPLFNVGLPYDLGPNFSIPISIINALAKEELTLSNNFYRWKNSLNNE